MKIEILNFKFFMFFVFIVSHAQLMQVASCNFLCTARDRPSERQTHPLKNKKKQKIQKITKKSFYRNRDYLFKHYRQSVTIPQPTAVSRYRTKRSKNIK